ncbi:MAG: Ldh family oxidoreductase [Rubricella sp.]
MAEEFLSIEVAEALVARALEANRTSAENAAKVARALVRAEADGQGGHGLSRVPSYAVQARAGKIDGFATPVLEDLAPATFRVDARHGFAYPAFDLAFDAITERARGQGIAACAIHRSHHFGVAGHHCETLAERGLVAFVFGNAPKAMAAWGGTRPILGTNPIAFAAPTSGAPLVIDMATTTVARGKILAAKEKGEPIPEGWALGPDGAPTTDAAIALKGTVAPMGGAKGAALALMVEVMSAALAGAALGVEASSLFDAEGGPPELGQTILALDPGPLSGGVFLDRMAAIASLYGSGGARMPGTRRLAARERATREGLSISPVLLAKIRELTG